MPKEIDFDKEVKEIVISEDAALQIQESNYVAEEAENGDGISKTEESDDEIEEASIQSGWDYEAIETLDEVLLHSLSQEKFSELVFRAIDQENIVMLAQLLSLRSQSINNVGFNGCGNTPLIEAVITKNRQIVKLLLDHGADVNGFSEQYSDASMDLLRVPLTMAVGIEFGRKRKLLLDRFVGVDFDRISDSDYDEYAAALRKEISKDDLAMVELLLEYGADLNVLSFDTGCSADAVRCAFEAPEVLKLLLDQGVYLGGTYFAVARLYYIECKTVLDCAVEHRVSPAVIDMLFTYGAPEHFYYEDDYCDHMGFIIAIIDSEWTDMDSEKTLKEILKVLIHHYAIDPEALNYILDCDLCTPLKLEDREELVEMIKANDALPSSRATAGVYDDPEEETKEESEEVLEESSAAEGEKSDADDQEDKKEVDHKRQSSYQDDDRQILKRSKKDDDEDDETGDNGYCANNFGSDGPVGGLGSDSEQKATAQTTSASVEVNVAKLELTIGPTKTSYTDGGYSDAVLYVALPLFVAFGSYVVSAVVASNPLVEPCLSNLGEIANYHSPLVSDFLVM